MKHNQEPPHHLPPPEFSRTVNADTVQRGEVVQTINANAAERAALARRMELESIGSLTATVRLHRVNGTMIRVSGTLEADVVQTCVVTLDPVPAHVSETFEALFAPDDLVPDDLDEIDFDPNVSDEDIPEPMDNNRIDIGELTAQYLSLGLDPYPHAPGIAFESIEEVEEEEVEAVEERPNPFAALRQLKKPN